MSDNNKEQSRFRFQKNTTYMTVSIYVLSVVIISSLFIALLLNLDKVADAFSFLASALSPFIVAFFIAYFLNPLVKLIDKKLLIKMLKIRKRKIRKILSILLSYILFIGALVLILIFIIPQFFDSLTELTNKIPLLYDIILDKLQTIETKLPSIDWAVIEEQINSSMPQIMEISGSLVSSIFPKLINFSISIVSVMINLVLSLVISCYMVSDKHQLADNAARVVYAVMPKAHAENFCKTVKECNVIFSAFVIGKALDSLIIGLLCFIIMSIFGLSYALLISVVVGVTNMIPYFGPFIGAIPSIVILLLIEPVQAVIFTVLVLVLQQFDGLYLGPKILGQSVGLKPLWVIFGITLGGACKGLLGMFLGVPITAVVAFLLNKWITAGLARHGMTDDDVPRKSEAYKERREKEKSLANSQ